MRGYFRKQSSRDLDSRSWDKSEVKGNKSSQNDREVSKELVWHRSKSENGCERGEE